MLHFFILLLIPPIRTYLNPKGPTHEKYALNCLQDLIINQFKRPELHNNQQLLTVLLTENLTSPAFELQEKLLGRINRLQKYNIEVISSERKSFNNEIYTKYCLIIIDSLHNFDKKLQTYLELDSKDPEAFFLIYYTTIVRNYKRIASYILQKLWKNFMSNTLILLPKNLRTFLLFTFEFAVDSGQNCLHSSNLNLTNTCVNGIFSTSRSYYLDKIHRQFANCSLDIIANKLDPFVINEKEGFEIHAVEIVGKVLNVTLNISLSGEDSWGVKRGRYWTKGLGRIYNDSVLGIGNFYVVPENENDFGYSLPYFHSSLVFIVPIASYVPKWRVLITIFNWYLWLLCITLILICAGLFWLLSLHSHEMHSYRNLAYDLLISIQVIINCSVWRQPISDYTRVVFISWAIFAIIISSVYTSSLIQFLTYPQREPQIDTIEGVLDMNWDIGGLPVHKSIFQIARNSDSLSRQIQRKFQVNDSLDIWLMSVADDRDTCTITSEFFIKYMLAKQDPIVTDGRNKSKIFILKKKIYSYGLRIVANKGFPFMDRIDHVVGLMNMFGLNEALANRYIWILSRVKFMQTESTLTQPLELKHLQGAFAIWLLGGLLGVLSFCFELLVAGVKRMIRKRNRKQKKKVKEWLQKKK